MAGVDGQAVLEGPAGFGQAVLGKEQDGQVPVEAGGSGGGDDVLNVEFQGLLIGGCSPYCVAPGSVEVAQKKVFVGGLRKEGVAGAAGVGSSGRFVRESLRATLHPHLASACDFPILKHHGDRFAMRLLARKCGFQGGMDEAF